MATKHMNDSWRRVKTQIQTLWEGADFDDSELKRARGNLSKMVNLIHEKTGEPRTAIRQKMGSIL